MTLPTEPAPSPRKLTAIAACYKDEQAIPFMAQRLQATFDKIGVDYEIIFVNDGSPDNTQTVIERLAASNPKIKGITCYVARPKTGGVSGARTSLCAIS